MRTFALIFILSVSLMIPATSAVDLGNIEITFPAPTVTPEQTEPPLKVTFHLTTTVTPEQIEHVEVTFYPSPIITPEQIEHVEMTFVPRTTPTISTTPSPSPWDKISPSLKEKITNTPKERVEVLLEIEDFKDCIKGLNQFCHCLCDFLFWLCDEVYLNFEEIGFSTQAITNDGYILGEIEAEKIPKLAEMKDVKYIQEEDGLSNKVNSISLLISQESLNQLAYSTDPALKIVTSDGNLMEIAEMREIYNVDPNQEISIIIVPNYTSLSDYPDEQYGTTGLILSILCALKEHCYDFCDWITSLIQNGFSLQAITKDGYIIGTIQYDKINNLVQDGNIQLIGIDNVQLSQIAPIPTTIDVNLNQQITVGESKLLATYEPIKFFGISIPWLKSENIQLEVSLDSRTNIYPIYDYCIIELNGQTYTVKINDGNKIELIP